MAKTPVLVTAAEWKKVKPVTLKDPGLDKKLAAWEAARKDVTAKPTMATVKKSADALADVVAMAKTTAAGANKTLHKDAITFLAGYPAAVAPLSKQLQKEGADISHKIQVWSQSRVDTLAAMKALVPRAKQLAAKTDATLKQHAETDSTNAQDVKRTNGLLNTVFDELGAFRLEAVRTVDVMRVTGAKVGTPHVDDRDQKFEAIFTKTCALQSQLEGLMLQRQSQVGGLIGKKAQHFQPGD